MAPGCRHLSADSVYNVVPAPISKFRGTWFFHIMTRHPQNIRPPWAALLNCFTGAKILGYICVCETLKLIQQIQDRRYIPNLKQKQHKECVGEVQYKEMKLRFMILSKLTKIVQDNLQSTSLRFQINV